jgi:hypothetical protein
MVLVQLSVVEQRLDAVRAADRFHLVPDEQRELLPLWLPPTFAEIPPPITSQIAGRI